MHIVQELLNVCCESRHAVVRQVGGSHADVERQTCNLKTCSNNHALAASQRLRR